MAKVKKDDTKAKVKNNNNIMCSGSDDSIGIIFDYNNSTDLIKSAREDIEKYNNMRKNETFDKAMSAFKGFVKDHSYLLIDGGDSEVDEYIKNLFESKNMTTADFEEMMDIILESGHYGEYGLQIVWDKDKEDQEFPKKFLGIKPDLYNYDKKGNIIVNTDDNSSGCDSITTGKKLNPYEFLAVSDFTNVGEIGENAKGKANYKNLLMIDQLEVYIDQIGSTGAIPRVIISIPSVDSAQDGLTIAEVNEKNAKAVASNITKLKSGSGLALTGIDVNQIKELTTSSLADVLNAKMYYAQKIEGNYYGNSKSYNSGSGGNNAEIVKIDELNKKYVKKYVLILEKAINRVFRIITDVVFGYDKASSQIKFNTKERPDSEKILGYWKEGLEVKASDIYGVLNISNPYEKEPDKLITKSTEKINVDKNIDINKED